MEDSPSDSDSITAFGPVGSEEIHLSSKAALTIKRETEKQLLLQLVWLDYQYAEPFGMSESVEQALISLFPNGWRSGGGFLSGDAP